MTVNLKDARIEKLARKGLTPEQIARKLGLPDTTRVLEGLARIEAASEAAKREAMAAFQRAVETDTWD